MATRTIQKSGLLYVEFTVHFLSKITRLPPAWTVLRHHFGNREPRHPHAARRLDRH